MNRCPRCERFHGGTDTVCDECWVTLMQQDQLPFDDDDWEQRHPIDTIFDRDLELQSKTADDRREQRDR